MHIDICTKEKICMQYHYGIYINEQENTKIKKSNLGSISLFTGKETLSKAYTLCVVLMSSTQHTQE